MKKVICTTTIYPPGEALSRFIAIANEDDWMIVIAGDLKTPHEQYQNMERLNNSVIYLSPRDQELRWPELSKAIGFNCIQRRNLAFVAAHELGAELIATVDDDNIPKPFWGRNLLLNQDVTATLFSTEQPAFDPISAAGYPNLWHRGFPLQLLKERKTTKTIGSVRADIQADFWDGDPDIDAFCRMEHGPNCFFHEKYFPFSANKISPFNSQNTFLRSEVMPHYFMFPHVGRMDDIWAAYHAQAQGFKVIYGPATVRQERNVQDLTVNMTKEFLGYQSNLKMVEQLQSDKLAVMKFLPDESKRAFDLYQKCYE